MSFILYISALVPFYLLGVFPSGYLLAKSRGIDITKFGSGNVGATNIARALGKRAGLVTLVCDIVKGLFGVFIASLIGTEDFVYLAGVAVVAGHCISIPPKLKGGKGVATALGVFLYLNYPAALTGLGVFIATFSATRIVSISSLAGAICIPVAAIFFGANNQLLLSLSLICLLVLIRHKSNLQKLVEGRESKFEFDSEKN